MDRRHAVSENLLQDIEQELVIRQDAKPVLRFINYLVDLLSFYALLVVAILLIALTGYARPVFAAIENMPDLLDFVLLHVLYGSYLLIVEGVCKGKTLGKLITGTRVVSEHSRAFGWRDALGRGAMRMIPLEYFTACTGSPFHDQWTATRVIKEPRKSFVWPAWKFHINRNRLFTSPGYCPSNATNVYRRRSGRGSIWMRFVAGRS